MKKHIDMHKHKKVATEKLTDIQKNLIFSYLSKSFLSCMIQMYPTPNL